MRTNVVTIEDGEVFTYPLRSRPAAALVTALRAKSQGIEIVNEAGEAGLARAAQIMLAQASPPDPEGE
jgi:hypothetical protein